MGVATQNPELRKRFMGKADYLVNFFSFLAEDVREHLAELGYRSLDEVIGRFDLLERNPEVDHWKIKNIDLSGLLTHAGWIRIQFQCIALKNKKVSSIISLTLNLLLKQKKL